MMTRVFRKGGLTVVAASFLAACGSDHGGMGNAMMGPSGMMGRPTGSPSGTYSSNGERIYFTATSSSGAPIS